MPHPYRIREIAQQSGLSEATVDRVLNSRRGVRAGTAREVHDAIADLDRQRSQVRVAGQTFLVDLVMQAPVRFTSAVRSALESALPDLRPASIRARFHLREAGGPGDVVSVLERLGRTGSKGVLLKSPDDPRVVAAVNSLAEAGIPTVTLVTDLPVSRRVAYVGIDNRAAGATAAYLITRMTPGPGGGVLVSLSSTAFRGEEEREMGFRGVMRDLAPHRRLVEVADTDGLNDATLRAASAALRADPGIDAVYSIGGGNAAILEAFRSAGRDPAVFVAHDMDDDNSALLRQGRITAVLHHDLRSDLLQACRLVLQARGALQGQAWSRPSQIHVVTPYNAPSR